MPTLSVNEADVLAIVRNQCGTKGRWTTTGDVADRARRCHGLAYHQVSGALASLKHMGLVTKPKHGHWQPVEDRAVRS